MFGKKKGPENIKLPPALPESNGIKERVGDVPNGDLRGIGMDIEPPQPPSRNVPRAPAAPVEQQIPAELAAPRAPEGPDMAALPRLASPSIKTNPPLFIKIDKYRELVGSISELKSYILSLRDALDALMDIEKELKNGLNITQMALDKFNHTIAIIDSKILGVGAKEGRPAVEVSREFEDYMKDLYDHIERIKHELRTIKE